MLDGRYNAPRFGGEMKKLLLVIILLFLTSCATTKISSFINPDIDISNYKNILVFGNIRDIEIRKTLESDIVSAFIENNLNCISSINIFSPLKDYSEQEREEILIKNNIDGIITVCIISAGENSAYIPQQTYINYSSQYVNGQLIRIPYTTTSGGYSVSYPKADFEITLTDIVSGKLAYKATANSEGDEFSDMKTISRSLAKEIVKEYISLISGKNNKPFDEN